MFRGRGPFKRASRAPPTFQCQKCLQRDNYECTTPAQERPYQARPSRTQQLHNPKLKPKLTTEVPNDLLQSKGVADKFLKAKEEERASGRKASRDESYGRRSRSSSIDSVSTVSTNRDRSPSLRPTSRREPRERRRSRAYSEDRSPSPRRLRSESRSRSRGRVDRKRARKSRSRSSSSSAGPRKYRRRASLSPSPVRHRRVSLSPPSVRGRRTSSPSPIRRRRVSSSPPPYRQPPRNQRDGPDHSHQGGKSASDGQKDDVQRERSLSPYSRRVALTKAMRG